MTISVMITTRNRSAELGRALRALSAMRPPPDEVLITIDAGTDDSAEVARRECPACRLFVNQSRQGSVASRHQMLNAAGGEVVVSLDDDSYPVAVDFFGQLPDIFQAHPEAAVVSFPELRDDGRYSTPDKTPASSGRCVSAYANCAAAMRRDFYHACAGFPPFFEHMYEEPDYALQCYAQGAVVWFEPSLTVRHHVSAATRRPLRRHRQNARNELWSVWLRCPWPWAPLVSLYRIGRQFRYACSQGLLWAASEPLWWTEALIGLPKCLKQRSAVPWPVYRDWMHMNRQAPQARVARPTAQVEAAAP